MHRPVEVASLKRVFAIDVETCPECGGKLRIIACMEDPQVMAKILGQVRSREEKKAIEARAPPRSAVEALPVQPGLLF